MVPVPEELEEEVQHLLRWKLSWPKDDIEPVTFVAAFERALRELDEPSSRLLVSVARHAAENEPFTVGDAGRVLGCNAREIIGTVLELNAAVHRMGGPPATLLTPEKAGETSFFENRPFFMAPEVAQSVLEAANAT